MTARPEATDEEVSRYKNFDTVLHQYHVRGLRYWQRGFYGAVGGALVGAAIFLMLPHESSPLEVEPSMKQEVTNPVDDSLSKNDLQEDKGVTRTAEEPVQKRRVEKGNISKPAESVEQSREDASPAATYEYLEAEPVAGFPHLYAYFDSELHYPQEAIADSVEGTLSVSFVIDTSGKPVKIAIQDSPGPLFDKETLRLIENMPAWRPASINGKSVPSRISLPLTFRIVRPAPRKEQE